MILNIDADDDDDYEEEPEYTKPSYPGNLKYKGQPAYDMKAAAY